MLPERPPPPLTFGRWVFNILIAVDQLGNAMSGGHPKQTISSRLGRIKLANDGVVPKRTWIYMGRPLDKALHWLDKNHVEEAVRNEEADGF